MKTIKLIPIIDKKNNLIILTKNISKKKIFNKIKICFSLIYSIKSIKNAEIHRKIGRYYEITNLHKKDFRPKQEWIIKITLEKSIKIPINQSAGPKGIFCLDKNNNKIDVSIEELRFEKVIPFKKYTKTRNNEFGLSLIPIPYKYKFYDKKINCKFGFQIKNKSLKYIINTTNRIIGTSEYFKINNKGIKLYHKKIQFFKEGYKLIINDDEIKILYSSKTGLFYAIVSLLQILITNNFSIKKGYIEDYPRFAWRGMHLDCARQFYSVDTIKRLINFMALYKLNKLHLHLTDNEAWRLNLKSYPKLAKNLSFRGLNMNIPPTYGSGIGPVGGSYSKKELKSIIRYAKKLSIDVMPEIDMPGHSWGLVNNFNRLREKEDLSWNDFEGVYKNNTLNPGLDFTWTFIKKIISEVAEIFPFEIIHIGSDEIAKNSWKRSPAIKKLMKRHRIKNFKQVKNYFIEEVQKILNSYNKKIAIWNDGISYKNLNKKSNKDCLIFAWENEKVAINAINKGFNVVLGPAQKSYFDMAYNDASYGTGLFWAGTTETKDVFEWEPISKKLKNKLDKINGIQGHLWSETITNINFMDIMINPRLIALSEVAWSKSKKRKWLDFRSSLGKNIVITKKIGWNHHKF